MGVKRSVGRVLASERATGWGGAERGDVWLLGAGFREEPSKRNNPRGEAQ